MTLEPSEPPPCLARARIGANRCRCGRNSALSTRGQVVGWGDDNTGQLGAPGPGCLSDDADTPKICPTPQLIDNVAASAVTVGASRRSGLRVDGNPLMSSVSDFAGTGPRALPARPIAPRSRSWAAGRNAATAQLFCETVFGNARSGRASRARPNRSGYRVVLAAYDGRARCCVARGLPGNDGGGGRR